MRMPAAAVCGQRELETFRASISGKQRGETGESCHGVDAAGGNHGLMNTC